MVRGNWIFHRSVPAAVVAQVAFSLLIFLAVTIPWLQTVNASSRFLQHRESVPEYNSRLGASEDARGRPAPRGGGGTQVTSAEGALPKSGEKAAKPESPRLTGTQRPKPEAPPATSQPGSATPSGSAASPKPSEPAKPTDAGAEASSATGPVPAAPASGGTPAEKPDVKPAGSAEGPGTVPAAEPGATTAHPADSPGAHLPGGTVPGAPSSSSDQPANSGTDTDGGSNGTGDKPANGADGSPPSPDKATTSTTTTTSTTSTTTTTKAAATSLSTSSATLAVALCAYMITGF